MNISEVITQLTMTANKHGSTVYFCFPIASEKNKVPLV